jgi:putative phosphoesterase
MMKIIVLSDTHVNDIDDLPGDLVNEINRVDIIVHAGDYTGKILLDKLRRVADFKGVCGNMDPFVIKSELPEVCVFDVEGFNVGITHPIEGGFPFKLENKVRQKFKKVDVIVFGHSHRSSYKKINDVLYINPGSATGKFPAKYRSYGVLEIKKKIEARIVKF